MHHALALMTKIAEAPSVDAVWTLATGYYRDLGFSRANYGFTSYLHGIEIGDLNDALYLTTCDADYARLYFREKLFARTAMHRWTLDNVGACTWRWVKDAYDAGTLNPDEADSVRTNLRLGVTAGVTISFPLTLSRAKGALGLIGDQGLSYDDVDVIWERQGEMLRAVAHMMHLRIISLPHLAPHRSLTLRQRQALEWVADGKTTQDVALLMGISMAMVEKHLRLARMALDVDTTAQAVAKASRLHLIFQRVPADSMVGKT